MQNNIGVIVGSLRKGAHSRLLAEAVMRLSPRSLSFVEIGIGELPLYNEDLDGSAPPQSWSTLRSQVASADGVLFVTPEYNRSIPGALKNAIDVGSRPWGRSVWSGKPTAIISQATGALGGAIANQQLRLTMSVLDSQTLPGNEMYISRVAGLFDKDGKLNNPDTRQLITNFLQAFEIWIRRFK